MKTIELQSKIGEIVAADYRFAGIFQKYDIDFCCGGGRSITDACQAKGVNAEEVLKELLLVNAVEPSASVSNYGDWDLSFLIDYIVNKHHLYVRKKLPEISAYAEKVAKIHGENHPETVEVSRLFGLLSEELTAHMAKEENILFPYVKMMLKARKQGSKAPVPPFGSVRNPIGVMEHEHDFAGETMRRIRELTSGFTPPEDACTTYRVFYANLKEFENNLHEHVHLENNILFPKAEVLESELWN